MLGLNEWVGKSPARMPARQLIRFEREAKTEIAGVGSALFPVKESCVALASPGSLNQQRDIPRFAKYPAERMQITRSHVQRAVSLREKET